MGATKHFVKGCAFCGEGVTHGKTLVLRNIFLEFWKEGQEPICCCDECLRVLRRYMLRREEVLARIQQGADEGGGREQGQADRGGDPESPRLIRGS